MKCELFGEEVDLTNGYFVWDSDAATPTIGRIAFNVVTSEMLLVTNGWYILSKVNMEGNWPNYENIEEQLIELFGSKHFLDRTCFIKADDSDIKRDYYELLATRARTGNGYDVYSGQVIDLDNPLNRSINLTQEEWYQEYLEENAPL